MSARRPIRVLVVDDSAVMRKVLSAILQREPGIEVVATAVDGVIALRKCARFRPDVVTLDLEMPGMDGLEVLRKMQGLDDAPVVVVSAHTRAGAEASVNALSLGAVDVVAKPKSGEGLDRLAAELLAKVKGVAGRRWRRPPVAPPARKPSRPAPTADRDRPWKVVAIGVSTGGPAALGCLLPRLPADIPAAFLVVQHMPEGFTAMLAHRLNQACALEVQEARDGDALLPGRVLLAPGGRHMRVRDSFRGPVALVESGPLVSGHCPSVDVMLRSVATAFGERAIGVLMTGMGEDGAVGMEAIRRASGATFAQDEESCVVFGMPRAAILKGAVGEVVPLEQMADAILAAVLRPGGRSELRPREAS